MNRKLIAALIALTLITPSAALAAPKTVKNSTLQVPTLAILDTALDTSLPIFKDKIAQEVCITEYNTCPNLQGFMEGLGSSTLPLKFLKQGGFEHGTQMASIAVKANPNMQIVFVRIIGNTANGSRQIVNEKTIYTALNWVIANKDQYNIQAVSMSQGHHTLLPGADYCNKTPITQSRIQILASMNVPVFFPTGNARDYSRIDWPACIPEGIAVGATTDNDDIAIYSNADLNLTDFYALGNLKSTLPGGALTNTSGTSASAQIAAAQWIAIKTAKPLLSYTEIYNLISKTSLPTRNSKVPSGKLINLAGALNG